MVALVVILSPIVSLLGHQQLPIPQVFAVFGFFAALSSMLIGYAAFPPQKH